MRVRPCVIVGVICGSWMVERGYMTMVLIDMDKPENCMVCPFTDADEDCILRKKETHNMESFWEQYAHCPLKEVQT